MPSRRAKPSGPPSSDSGSDSDSDTPDRVKRRPRPAAPPPPASAWSQPLPELRTGTRRASQAAAWVWAQRGVRGVYNNRRNLCWFASLLQVLIATPGFTQDLANACLELHNTNMPPQASTALHALLVFVSLLLAWHDTPAGTAFDPAPHLARFTTLEIPATTAHRNPLPQHFTDGEPHDLAEELGRLRNLLSETLPVPPGSLPPPCPGSAAFQGYDLVVHTTHSCPHCKKVEQAPGDPELYLTIAVDPGASSPSSTDTLDAALARHFAKETLEMTCPIQGRQCMITATDNNPPRAQGPRHRQLHLTEHARSVLIQLKTDVYGSPLPLSFPKLLNLAAITDGRGQPSAHTLHCVVTKLRNPDHYITYIPTNADSTEWLELNDSTTDQLLTWSEITKIQPYLLLYSQDTPHLPALTDSAAHDTSWWQQGWAALRHAHDHLSSLSLPPLPTTSRRTGLRSSSASAPPAPSRPRKPARFPPADAHSKAHSHGDGPPRGILPVPTFTAADTPSAPSQRPAPTRPTNPTNPPPSPSAHAPTAPHPHGSPGAPTTATGPVAAAAVTSAAPPSTSQTPADQGSARAPDTSDDPADTSPRDVDAASPLPEPNTRDGPADTSPGDAEDAVPRPGPAAAPPANPEPSPNDLSVLLYFDGGENRGHVGAGSVIYNCLDGSLIWSASTYVMGPEGRGTNNVGEYEGLLQGLAHALTLKPTRLRVRGDSELIINHVTNRANINTEHLRQYYDKTQNLLHALRATPTSVTFEHVRRTHNDAADDLCSLAICTRSSRSLEAPLPPSPRRGGRQARSDHDLCRHGFDTVSRPVQRAPIHPPRPLPHPQPPPPPPPPPPRPAQAPTLTSLRYGTLIWVQQGDAEQPAEPSHDPGLFPAVFEKPGKNNSFHFRWARSAGGRTCIEQRPTSFYAAVLSDHDIEFFHGLGDLTGCPSPAPDSDRALLPRSAYLQAHDFLRQRRDADGNAPSTNALNGLHLPSGMQPEHWEPAAAWLLSQQGTYKGKDVIVFDPSALVTGNWHTSEDLPSGLHSLWQRIGSAVLHLGLQFRDQGNAAAADAFVGLFHALPLMVLRVPPSLRGRKRTAVLAKHLNRFVRGDWAKLFKEALPRQPSKPPHAAGPNPGPGPEEPTANGPTLAQGRRAVELVRAGNASKATAYLTGPGIKRGDAADIVAELRDKHPQSPSPDLPHAPPLTQSEITDLNDLSDPSKIHKAVKGIPARGAPDQWGWRGREHLLPLLRDDEAAKYFSDLIIRPLQRGLLPGTLRSTLAGASLFALSKGAKPGVRPIAVGDLFRKITAKVCLQPHKFVMASHFQTHFPHVQQYAVGLPSGAEKLFHALQLRLAQDSDPHDPLCVLTLDTTNAFNSLSRQILFDVLGGTASRDYAEGRIPAGSPLPCPPGLRPFLHHLIAYYGSPSTLHHRDTDGNTCFIDSSTGPQQGDVWGTALFCASIHPLLGAVLEDAAFAGAVNCFCFSDNIQLCGPVSQVLAMCPALAATLEEVGLPFNTHESCLHVPSWSSLPDQGQEEWHVVRESLSGGPNSVQYSPSGLKIVGSPLGTDDFCSAVLARRVDKIIADLPKLHVIRDGLAHFILLKYCINARFRFSQRCSPPRLTAPLGAKLDAATLDSLCQYLGIDPFHSPEPLPQPPSGDIVPEATHRDALIQFRLPIKQGGAGFTSVEGTSTSSFYNATATSVQWLACTSDSHRSFIPDIPDLSGHVPQLLADLRDAQAELARAGAEFVTPAQVRDPDGLPRLDPGALRCPNWATLLLHAPPPLAARPLFPVPPQKSVTAFLFTKLSLLSPERLSEAGRERLDHFKERTIQNVAQTAEGSPIFATCLQYRAVIPSNSLSFLCFTPGSSAVDFPWHLWRLWLAHFLGLPIPLLHEDARLRVAALGNDPHALCECGSRPDLFGHHRLCCLRVPNTTASRYDAHNSIRDEILACARLGNLRASPRAPQLPHQNPQERGDLIITLTRSYARGVFGPAKDQFWDEIIGDVTLVHPRQGATRDRNRWGTWRDDTVKEAIKTKRNHYSSYEHNSRLCFLPLVISTYNDMCDDLLRLLWLIAEAQLDLAVARNIVDIDSPLDKQVKMVAARIRSRIACASAVGVAKRLASFEPHDFRRAQPSSDRAPLDFHLDEPLCPF